MQQFTLSREMRLNRCPDELDKAQPNCSSALKFSSMTLACAVCWAHDHPHFRTVQHSLKWASCKAWKVREEPQGRTKVALEGSVPIYRFMWVVRKAWKQVSGALLWEMPALSHCPTFFNLEELRPVTTHTTRGSLYSSKPRSCSEPVRFQPWKSSLCQYKNNPQREWNLTFWDNSSHKGKPFVVSKYKTCFLSKGDF